VIVTDFELNITHRYDFSRERLVRPPWAAESQGWQNEHFKIKKKLSALKKC